MRLIIVLLASLALATPAAAAAAKKGGQGVACNLVTRTAAEKAFGAPLDIGDSTATSTSLAGSAPSADMSECQFSPTQPPVPPGQASAPAAGPPVVDKLIIVTIYFPPFNGGDWEKIARSMSVGTSDPAVREVEGLGGTAIWHFTSGAYPSANLWFLNDKVQIFTYAQGFPDEASALDVTKALVASAVPRVDLITTGGDALGFH